MVGVQTHAGPSHVLVMKGAVRVGDETLATHEFVVFANDGDRVDLQATEDAQLLVLSGEPIGEPIVQYGPFVMNTEQEIVQAFEDLRAGRFGHLAD